MNGYLSFAVNGRFLTQPVTGVQRYAWNVCAAINASLSLVEAHAPIIAPPSAPDPGFSAMPLIGSGPFSGQLWKRSVLPARCQGRLLNLGNLGPLVTADQVICIHDANKFVEPESCGGSFRVVYSTVQRVLARRAAHRYLPVRAADIEVLPTGHEHALAWDPASARIAPSDADERGFVLALGSRARHKKLQLLINIAPQVAAMGLEVVIAGGGAGIFTEEVLASLPNVKMFGQLTDHHLAYLMDRAVCLVFPSWTEGFGLPIVEAMARGCPVISSDRVSMPEVCGDAALMAAPDNSAAWTSHLHRLLASPELRRDLITRGRGQVGLFSWTKTAAQYLDLMRDPTVRFR
jgi:glycosyltransferase involved in cell wall biosynthesis